MRKILILFFVFLVSSIYSATFQTLNIKEFQIQAPSDWTVKEEATVFMTVFIIFSPIEKNDQFRENCNLIKETLPKKMTVNQYIEAGIPQIKKVAQFFKILKRGENFMIYDAGFNNFSVRQLQYYFVRENTGYVLTFSAIPDTFNQYLPIFERMAMSFKIQ